MINLLSQKEATLSMLNGMFAFAYVDENKGNFIIARDRLGVKPLYYTLQNGVLYFASELPTLLEFGLKKEISKLALNKYLRFGNIASPETIYQGIFKLEPGHFLIGRLNEQVLVEKRCWWSLPSKEDDSLTESQWLEKIDDLLLDATKIRLISDVPVGLFLSGGLDSSLVAHYASKQNEFQKPKAFTVVFNEEDYNEYPIAKDVAKHEGLELVPLKLEQDAIKDLDLITANIGEPFSDSSLINQYYLSKEARKHATVFLTGDGGDEAFGGYTEYLKASRLGKYFGTASSLAKILYSPMQWLIKDDTNLKQQLAKLSIGPKYLGAGIRMNFMEPILTKLIGNQFKVDTEEITEQIFMTWDKSQGLPLVKRMQFFDYIHYLEPDVLTKVDRATMLHSIEARSPFLDYRVVELGLSIPNEHNIDGKTGKNLLRKLALTHLPATVAHAPKKGFGLPYRNWINEEMKKHVFDLNKKNGHNIWDKEIFRKVVQNADTPKYDMYSIFWRIWMFEEWYKSSFKN
ncbi:MAG: asparagine synthase (glutamine-hydrolyzing) [Saprospiraceae bacterium]|nr:asparagine synthase (glutamine-hydrolyzing) [Saprospiraceae bacterium]